MIEVLSKNLIALARECPFPLYVVGGSVRDFYAGLKSEQSDVDICAPVLAEEFANIAKRLGFGLSAAYKNTGTLKLFYGDESYEFASFRSDEYVRGHVPARAYFTDDISLDAARRDFKCNAVYYDIKNRRPVDPLGGLEDIKNRTLSAVADPNKVFGEDGLRLMRLARIAAQTGFTPTDGCLKAARDNCGLIAEVSAERIYGELDLILHADLKYGEKNGVMRGLKILKETGVLRVILPELCAGEGLLQRPDKHIYDVLDHSIACAACANPQIRLAALLHDVGKPAVYFKNGNFHGHDKEGAPICRAICQRLKAPKKLTEEAVRLTLLHMYDLTGEAKENKVRRFIVQNYDIFDKILFIKQADFSASCGKFTVAPAVEKFTKIYNKMAEEGVPFTLKELNLKGGDLLAAGYPPAAVGKTLLSLLNDCCIGAVKNLKPQLLEYAIKVFPPQTAR